MPWRSRTSLTLSQLRHPVLGPHSDRKDLRPHRDPTGTVPQSLLGALLPWVSKLHVVMNSDPSSKNEGVFSQCTCDVHVVGGR